jgi:hypothetical protein
MNKINIYLIGAAIVIFCAAVMAANLYRQRFLQQRDRADRLLENQSQLLQRSASYKKLYITHKELADTKDARIDSLLSELKVKPKHVTRYVERWHHTVDTIIKRDTLVVLADKYTWPFVDTSSCFIFAGNVLIGENVVLEVTRREYTNQTTEVAYLERSKKFLGIRYGPLSAKIYVKNTCGADQIRDIEVVKK